ncbi:MAG: hypothetical protein A2186_00550 [Candidatus Levybacteria bacterium RIFOXYA1_FULL_41_10]|nr:MAG: hypothetical protein A2186_00550 [Candidatus Levybacteria bacterium RIFOXYA1_FULL_41_10]
MKSKSSLQTTLEAEGWEFLTNNDRYNGKYWDPDPKKNDFAIISAFKDRGFKEVKVTDAYDINGRPINYMQAIYVKR